MDEQLNVNDSYLATIRVTNALDIPDITDKETAIKLVRAAQRMVNYYLFNQDFNAVKDTIDSLEAVESFLRAKVGRQQADRIVQNTVAAGRFRCIRDVGIWAIDNINHNGRKTAGRVNLEDRKDLSSRQYVADTPLAIKSTKVLKDMGIGQTTLTEWMIIGGLDEDEFESFLLPWVNETIWNNMELTYPKLRYFIYPSSEKKPDRTPPISLSPELKTLYQAIYSLKTCIDTTQSKFDIGTLPPINQIKFIYDRFTDLVDEINKFMRETSERY